VNLVSNDVTGKAGTPRPASDYVSVLHLNAGNLHGGVETLLATLARLRHLCPGMEPHFAVCYEGRMSRELVESGVPVRFLGPVRMSRPWTVWRARRRLRTILHSEPVDVVICHMAWSFVLFAGTAKASGCKVVLWIHGFQSQTYWLDRIARWIIPDLAIANSHSTARTVREHFPAARTEMVYYPVALLDEPEAPQWRASLRKDQGIGDDTTVILQVSRLEPWKGHMIHLRALSQLPAAKNWICWIVGGSQTPEEDNYFRKLRENAQDLGIGDRVKFLGQRTDVSKLLAASDIFCQPNQGPEPFGLVFVEALWAGKPVVSSSFGGAQEIVDGSCGLLVPPNDPNALSKALLELIESRTLCNRLGSAGPARAHQLCDPAAQMEKLKNLFASRRKS
jgi:glycosyltransferase involved in cell wall biosynthesis